jgi:hypothetical protein
MGQTNGTVKVSNLKKGSVFYYADSKTKTYAKFIVKTDPKLNEKYNQWEFIAFMGNNKHDVDFYINNFTDINNDSLYYKLKELKKSCPDCRRFNEKSKK